MNDLYKSIGNTLKKQYLDTNTWIISSNFEAIKYIGLRSKTKIKLFNGKLESRLMNFIIYEGTKKKGKIN
jgi:putative N6-adenine-specific DNA methylase